MQILYKIKKYGAVGSIRIFLKKLFNVEIIKFHYLSMKLDRDLIQIQLKDFDLDVKELSYDDFLLGDQKEFNNEKLKIIKERSKDPTYIAYGIVGDNKLIYSAWISLKKLGLPVRSNILLSPTQGYFEDDFCHPAYRGLGIHGKMNIFRKSKLIDYGKTECIITVIDGNEAALKSHIKSGAQNLGCFFGGYFFGLPFVIINKQKYDSF